MVRWVEPRRGELEGEVGGAEEGWKQFHMIDQIVKYHDQIPDKPDNKK